MLIGVPSIVRLQRYLAVRPLVDEGPLTHTGNSLRLPSTAGLGHLAAVRIAIG